MRTYRDLNPNIFDVFREVHNKNILICIYSEHIVEQKEEEGVTRILVSDEVVDEMAKYFVSIQKRKETHEYEPMGAGGWFVVCGVIVFGAWVASHLQWIP